jgi:hypothetical protein
MFHLDYLSWSLTILATILLARKSWIGLLVAIANSLIVCVIGLRTSQLGFIPANLFCIGVYAFSMRSWLKERTHANRDQAQLQKSLVVPTHNGAGFCTEFTNWRKLVNIPIRQLPYFQRFTRGNWIASLTASEDAKRPRERKDAENSKVGERGGGLFAKWPNEPGRYPRTGNTN